MIIHVIIWSLCVYFFVFHLTGGQADPTSESEKLNEVKATRKAREGKKKDN